MISEIIVRKLISCFVFSLSVSEMYSGERDFSGIHSDTRDYSLILVN